MLKSSLLQKKNKQYFMLILYKLKWPKHNMYAYNFPTAPNWIILFSF